MIGKINKCWIDLLIYIVVNICKLVYREVLYIVSYFFLEIFNWYDWVNVFKGKIEIKII